MLFFLLCLTSFFSLSALNDLAGPSAGPLARKTYSYSFIHVFIVSGMDIASKGVFSRPFSSFESFCPPRKVQSIEWNLSLILRNLTHPTYEPLKLSEYNHLTWITCCLLALILAKRIGELHGLSYRVHHWKGWMSFALLFLPDFVAKIQNPSMYNSHFG